MTEEEEELPCFSALLDSGSEPGMTFTLLEQDPSWLSSLWMTEEERELSASDGDHESSSPHAARNATMKMDPIAAMRLQDDSTKNFFINTSLSLTLKIEYSINTFFAGIGKF
jgi:hypothetical protein